MTNNFPNILPILQTEEIVLFPGITESINIPKSEENLSLRTDGALERHKFVGVVAKTKKGLKKIKIGTVGEILDIKDPESIVRQEVARRGFDRLKFKLPNLGLFLDIKGVSRFEISRITQDTPYYLAEIRILPDQISHSANEIAAFTEMVKAHYKELLEFIDAADKDEVLETILESKDPGFIADFVAANLPIWILSLEDKQIILETLNIKERLEKISYFLEKEILTCQTQKKIVKEVGESQRKMVLEEEIRILEGELKKLGKEREKSEVAKYREKAAKAKLPQEAKKEFEEELERFAQAGSHDPTNQYRGVWLDWMVSLPWNQGTIDCQDLQEAEKILEEDHYGLEKVKKRVLEFLAIRKLKPQGKSPILCFIGPPGTGKTSVGKSIARAMGRKFIRISLGGAKDERQLRGFERTYVGALPGIVIQELKRADSNNPVFMIDEIDKVGTDWQGDPTSALLEILDPEQNLEFRDHYLGIPFDLSKVMFICTGNLIDPIQPALKDRMEILEFPGYTREEKSMIAKKYLLPKQIEVNGLNSKQIQFEEKTLESIITDYTREAGVRNLEREIGNVCRKVATKIVKKEISQQVVSKDRLSEFLGTKRFISTLKERISRPGIAIGLAWTTNGGEILFIESEVIVKAEKSELQITGNVEKIMQESAMAALTYVEANLDLLKINPIGKKIHIHVPEAAIPKDGPSAGLAILVALVSLLSKRKVRDDVAMTGEITLRGKVLPVGGIKEKVLAAKESGVKLIILPEENRKDEEDLPLSVREAIKRGEIKLRYVSEMKEAIDLALEK